MFLSTLVHGSDKLIKFKAIMAKECSSKIVNFITIWAEGLMLGRGYISHHSEYALQYTSHWLLLY